MSAEVYNTKKIILTRLIFNSQSFPSSLMSIAHILVRPLYVITHQHTSTFNNNYCNETIKIYYILHKEIN